MFYDDYWFCIYRHILVQQAFLWHHFTVSVTFWGLSKSLIILLTFHESKYCNTNFLNAFKTYPTINKKLISQYETSYQEFPVFLFHHITMPSWMLMCTNPILYWWKRSILPFLPFIVKMVKIMNTFVIIILLEYCKHTQVNKILFTAKLLTKITITCWWPLICKSLSSDLLIISSCRKVVVVQIYKVVCLFNFWTDLGKH